MIPYIPPSAGAFTGLTKLLNGSASDMSAGWRYSDPGWSWFVTGLNDKSIPWSTNDPHVALEFVGLLVSSNLWDVPQTKYFATQIFCELASNATNTTDDSLQLDWPYPMPSLFLPDNTSLGCFTSSIAPTIFHCCDNCRSRLACRALYYHLETGQCWLSLYVDSLLPTNMSTIQGKWRRFGRPNW
ncbi:hypothetical protein D915_006151 [Fasciola hepatica]|uniref:Apple domain-containing protein n=1 Tax=Fasciola hepatica TaxID=6192 RepID=A0A4E0R3I8_FASHE|nr:hypothetical protein D915_006151 [Fasciola hepatica]